MAVLNSSMMARTDRMGIISGDKGYMVVDNINNPQCIRVCDTKDQELARYTVPRQITGYEYEVLSAIRAVQEGRIECEEIPHEETLEVMRLMDALRAEWGVWYPFEV